MTPPRPVPPAPLQVATAGERTLRLAAVAVPWTLYAPLGVKYALWLLMVVLAALACRRTRSFPAVAWRRATTLATAALVGWLALSAAWSPAPATVIAGHLGLYGLWLSLPLLAATLPPDAARRALAHAVAASACCALLLVVHRWQPLPPSMLWHTTLDAEGNQRIANSVLLALGAAVAAWLAVHTNRVRWRWAWLTLAALIATGLALQDRRSGMLLLPALLLAWALAAPQPLWRRLVLALLVAGGATLAWQAADGVRGRFAEGLRELRGYAAGTAIDTSWGQRLRMAELTLQMVREQPLRGHGVGSWVGLWQQRTPPGTLLHTNTTPHNEYLLLAQQAGLPALLLWLSAIGASLLVALRAGAAGAPLLFVWIAIAAGGLFNAVLRDAKFALPLLLLAALAAAAARDTPPPGR